jgi:hypothetical protein
MVKEIEAKKKNNKLIVLHSCYAHVTCIYTYWAFAKGLGLAFIFSLNVHNIPKVY